MRTLVSRAARRHVRIVALAVLLVAGACTAEAELALREPVPGTTAGGTVAVAITSPSSIDPSTVDGHDPSGRLVVQTMCDPLIQLDQATGQPVPAIAESWTITDGGRRITVKMRSDLKFHDGTEVTSEDVAFTMFRVAAVETASPVASLLRDVDGYDVVHGETTADAGETPTELDGVAPIDKYSFEIRLTDRNADFLRALSHPALSPVPKAAVEADPIAFESSPVCAGPYRLAEPWEPEDPEIALVRSEEYDPKNLGYTNGGAGYAERIVFRVAADEAAAVEAYRAGEADVVRLPWDALAEARAIAPVDVVSGPTSTIELVGLPVSQPPFGRRQVRVALSQALDREAISSGVFDGARMPASGILPPAVGADLYREDACGDRAPASGDVAAARQTLDETGVDLSGTRVPLYFNDEFRNRRLMEAVARQWNEAFGLEAELVAMEWEQYLATATGQPGLDGPFRMGWAPQYPSPDGYLAPLFASSAIGRDNLTRFSDGDFDRALTRDARRATDEEDYRVEYQLLEDRVCGQMPVVPVGFGVAHHLVRAERLGSAVEDVVDRSSGDVALREIYVR